MGASIKQILSTVSLSIFFAVGVKGQTMNNTYLDSLLQAHPDLFGDVLAHPQKNEVQILYTRIDRDQHNTPHFTSFAYRLDPTWYFYPASTVKLPTAIFALEKINELNIKGLTKETSLRIDSAYEKQTKVLTDPTAADGLPSIEHYIKKVLLTSDNDGHNRLFEFVGRAEINRKLKQHGTQHSRIVNRLAIGDKGIWAKHTNPITFYNGKKNIYSQPAQYDANDYPMPWLQNTVQGIGYTDANDNLIHEPWSFEGLNVYALADQQLILKKLLFPEAFPIKQRFNLKKEDYAFLYKYMSRSPQETDFPKYNPEEFWPTYSKFVYFGRDKGIDGFTTIRSFNKYGDSYGYNIDNAYIVDFEKGIEFMVAVVIQSNDDGIYNDGIYGYETVTYPFLKNLGQILYQEEQNRVKKHKPNLEKFKF
ncbi:serine hydrolase [Sphingobacterium psychroaquaticum]|uniref:Beta-lactamase enzyme family protein n=1 Tax=Sphingobacterium psychroaquaticum TaxID=561061 RepID=A0A1X7L564_9SPHI|nr:serine hydrolase [Sphingobacterium psychroaquaticum]SMG48614.1 Beta-lactamase enzyme family protein [Sphingobacterium psychroaquaticum]